MSDTSLGLGAAVISALLYAASVTLQALEARAVPVEHQLRASLLGLLFRRPRWVLGTLLGLLGWPFQALALARAPLALVQPALACGLIMILLIAHWLLGERLTLVTGAAAMAVVAGIALLTVTLPVHESGSADPTVLALGLIVIAAIGLVPLLARQQARRLPMALAAAAGATYVWIALATKLLDDSIGRRSWIVAGVWLAAVAAAAAIGGISEMSAFQIARATRVVPVVFACETVAPALLAPLVGERLGLDPLGLAFGLVGLALVGAGVMVLARAQPVAGLVAGQLDERPAGS